MKHAREEILGPILSVITVKSLQEAIDIANETDLRAHCWNTVPAAVKNTPRKSVAVPAPVAALESGAEMTT